jgi:hypothetical protein
MATQYFGGPVVFTESVSAVTATPSVQLGTERQVGDELYRYVYNVGSSTAGVGYGVTVSATTGWSCTVSTTTSADIVIGVVKHVAIPTGSYGWVMTKGFAKVVMGADNSAAAGVMLTVGTDGTFAHATQTTNTAISPIVGKAMEAMASAGSGSAYLSLFGA